MSGLPDDALRETLLAELRCASMRARLAALDIDAVGTVLKFNLINPEAALAMLHDAYALAYLKFGEVTA